jgi:hypothetical protein
LAEEYLRSDGATVNAHFASRMRELERRFEEAADKDRDIYLPNFTPSGPVDAVFIAMEPSLAWLRSAEAGKRKEEAERKIKVGLRNFMTSAETSILHYTARRYLCQADETYHITDVSKGSMSVEKAKIDRRERYQRWYPLLKEEIDLVAKPAAHVVAIGREVQSVLIDQGFERPFSTIIHYSPQAAATRNRLVLGREDEFRLFSQALSMQEISSATADLMRENSVPTEMMKSALADLEGTCLTVSLQKLAFIYASHFQELRSGRGETGSKAA